MLRQLKEQKYKNGVSCVSWIHTSHMKHTVLDHFNMCMSNHEPFNYSRQES